ncbi:MAG TPA: YihY family inner membrane protein, partial [Candidatus Cloacimonadota bacterium]|nr:YihY family inner membrane protein [Candidatus Cloacimonadota bacterium]
YDVFTHPRKRKLILKNSWSFLRVFYKRVTTEGVLKESASLTYITLLGFIPFITFIVLIIPDLPFLDLRGKINDLLVNNLMPNSAAAVTSFIGGLLQQRTGFNTFGFILLIFSSYSLFRVIRNTFDRILSMDESPVLDWLSYIIKFFGTLIVGILIMLVLFSTSSMPLIGKLLKYSFLTQQLLNIIPFFLQFFALIFLYLILPSIRVKRGALFRGAFWTTVVWTMIKSLFDWYIYNLTNYQAVYGYLSILPITLLWIYVNWVVIIGGIVLISVLDQGNKLSVAKNEPKRVVRITMEMYSNRTLNKRLESYIRRSDLKELIDEIEEEEE